MKKIIIILIVMLIGSMSLVNALNFDIASENTGKRLNTKVFGDIQTKDDVVVNSNSGRLINNDMNHPLLKKNESNSNIKYHKFSYVNSAGEYAYDGGDIDIGTQCSYALFISTGGDIPAGELLFDNMFLKTANAPSINLGDTSLSGKKFTYYTLCYSVEASSIDKFTDIYSTKPPFSSEDEFVIDFSKKSEKYFSHQEQQEIWDKIGIDTNAFLVLMLLTGVGVFIDDEPDKFNRFGNMFLDMMKLLLRVWADQELQDKYGVGLDAVPKNMTPEILDNKPSEVF